MDRRLRAGHGQVELIFFPQVELPVRIAAALDSGRPPDFALGFPLYSVVSGDLRHDRIDSERVWAKAVQRVAADGISPEQAVDEAIAQIKQILSG